MAGMNPAKSIPITRAPSSGASRQVPRVLMSWEDWLTFATVAVVFLAIAVSIQQSNWVDDMPQLVPTVWGGLVVGLIAARVRAHGLLIQPVALAAGLVVVLAMVQSFATGETAIDRLGDTRDRMQEWWTIVRNGEISNDNLPFVLLVHSLAFLAAYAGSWSIFRWHNAWLALIPGAFILLTNISFQDDQPAAPFIIFLIAAMLVVGRTYLQKLQSIWRKTGVEYPEFISLNALTVTIALAGGLIIAAWQIPLADEDDVAASAVDTLIEPFEPLKNDAVRLFNSVNASAGGNFHSFGDTLPIRGDVSIGTQRLLTVELENPRPGLVRATSYDRYTGVGWQSTGRESDRIEGVEFLDQVDTNQYNDRIPTLIRVTVIDDESTLISLGIPLGTNLRAVVNTPEGFSGDIERLQSTRGLDRGDTYNVVGSVSIAAPDTLRTDSGAYPDWVLDRYLQLPDDLPVRVRDLAAELTASEPTAYDRALALQDYLRTFPYTFEVPTAPPGQDAVDYLLFDLQQGYFDYQATAMAVMLRSVGIPARIAVGYVLAPDAFDGTAFTVRKDHAFAWVEVYFPDYGWITFNPTSELPAGGAGENGDTSFDPNDFPGISQGEIPPEELFPPGSLDSPPPQLQGPLGESPVDAQQAPWWILWAGLVLLGLLAVSAAGGWLTWNWGLRGIEGRALLWGRTQKLARWASVGAEPRETPSEWGSRLGERLDSRDDARTIALAFEEERYAPPGRRRIPDDDVTGAYRRLRSALLARVFRLKRRTPGDPE